MCLARTTFEQFEFYWRLEFTTGHPRLYIWRKIFPKLKYIGYYGTYHHNTNCIKYHISIFSLISLILDSIVFLSTLNRFATLLMLQSYRLYTINSLLSSSERVYTLRNALHSSSSVHISIGSDIISSTSFTFFTSSVPSSNSSLFFFENKNNISKHSHFIWNYIRQVIPFLITTYLCYRTLFFQLSISCTCCTFNCVVY